MANDTPEKIAEKTFRSPINKENSFGQWSVAEDTESTMTLFYYDDNTGFIEWDIPEIEETVDIGLTFSIDKNGKRTLTDYDGVFAIPAQALDLLESQKVDVAEMRKAMRE